ncbi:hypothetical protein LC603019_00183 [Lawsonella clevelandensis]|uniref:Uncharacterized protein n=1 Tax=Lawsonella clevelandensis TaxID=1528099 RepID=A0A5E3ZVG5_9ACTN|nr:hypothetical protein LC603019_00183 [Lawsonella clevelandensis]
MSTECKPYFSNVIAGIQCFLGSFPIKVTQYRIAEETIPHHLSKFSVECYLKFCHTHTLSLARFTLCGIWSIHKPLNTVY